ncbi:MAG: hypothetical protein ACI8WT_001425 [Clostridium sp.]|jgi:hypothetical protein
MCEKIRMAKKTISNVGKLTDKVYIPQCHFCGGSVGEISERTGGQVNAIFDCPKCKVNYCDQCSYEDEEKSNAVQKCLRCDSELDKVTD